MTTQVAPIVGPSAPNSLLKIQKATIKKQLLAAEFSEQLTLEAKPREFTMQGSELVHPDLERCFAQLVPHFCLLTEQLVEHAEYEAAAGYWPNYENTNELPEHFETYEVTGIIMGSKNGVTLMGKRTLSSSKVLNMTSQYVSFEPVPEEEVETDVWHYEHAGRLETAVLDAIAEIEAALRGKCSEVGKQLDLFDAEQNKEEVIAEFGEVTKNFPATKKRRAKRIGE
ncbi:hypothetical protein [Hymenobacter sp. UV11]|uniref:hypothetical protein n=1 Tax=Hymenobacter sp. UV11 TaxID=1849735 RepID=UPI0010D8F12E|nr:hypothetical protein [Hymenobacter sp. UV11]TDN39294.1 hypothetical protein A8B98_18720 [Hymenobacter sp. UV11]